MTRSNFELAKGPFSANDNFQELRAKFQTDAGSKTLQIPRDSLQVRDHTGHRSEQPASYMVSGADELEQQHGMVSLASSDRFAGWTRKTKIGRRKVTRELRLPAVRDLNSAWHHARMIGHPVNRFITFRPDDINEQNPEQRIATWSAWRNKLAQFARDHRFDFTCLWTRESERHSGRNEHLHVLMHIPPALHRRFDDLVRSWCGHTDEIDVRRCSYQTRRNKKGGDESVLTYVSKNSPQAGRYLGRRIQLGGPIFGKRYGLSRNLDARARARHEVTGGLRRDLGLASITGGDATPPQAANDHQLERTRRTAA